jgi:antitoxin component of RelBE/YafQ-DinJ toxin-antitoxin module
MKKREDTGLPEFQSLDEEKSYWEERGPLAEGRKGRINEPKPGQRRSSFLAVRLTGEELTRLRQIAAQHGLGPSTFARLVLTAAIAQQGRLPRRVTLDELRDILETSLPQSVKDKAEALTKAAAVGDPDNPAMLIIDAGQKEAWEDFSYSFLSAVFAMVGVRVIKPESESYQKAKEILKATT